MIVDVYQTMFEKLLFSYSWREDKPENQIEDINVMPLELTSIGTEGDIKDHRYKYHNWITKIYKQKGEKTSKMLNEQAVVVLRRAAIDAIQRRIKNEQPDHSVNLIFAIDCEAYRDQAFAKRPRSWKKTD